MKRPWIRLTMGVLCLGWSLSHAMGTSPQQVPKQEARPAAGLSVMLKDDDLRAQPESSAPVLGRLAKGTSVRILANQGGWTRVTADSRGGWVRVLSVRSPAQSGADLAGLIQAGTSAPDAGRVVAVAGVRGLDEEMLKSAAFDPAQIQLLDGYALGRAEAEQFAQAAGLRAIALPYFESAEPDSARGATSNSYDPR